MEITDNLFENENKNKKYLPKTDKSVKDMAYGLMRWLTDRYMFYDSRIYFKHGKTWTAIQDHMPDKLDYRKETYTFSGKEYIVYVIDNIDPNNYFEYNGNILSMSFEGPLYDAMNGYQPSTVSEKLNNYFSHWGLYHELGNAWNFSLYGQD